MYCGGALTATTWSVGMRIELSLHEVVTSMIFMMAVLLLAVVMFATNERKGSTVGDEKEDCEMAMALMTLMMLVLPKCTM